VIHHLDLASPDGTRSMPLDIHDEVYGILVALADQRGIGLDEMICALFTEAADRLRLDRRN
jgi:hypothetical protein